MMSIECDRITSNSTRLMPSEDAPSTDGSFKQAVLSNFLTSLAALLVLSMS